VKNQQFKVFLLCILDKLSFRKYQEYTKKRKYQHIKYYKHINKIFHRIFNRTRFAKIKSWDQQNFGVISLLCYSFFVFNSWQLFFIKKWFFKKIYLWDSFFPHFYASWSRQYFSISILKKIKNKSKFKYLYK